MYFFYIHLSIFIKFKCRRSNQAINHKFERAASNLGLSHQQRKASIDGVQYYLSLFTYTYIEKKDFRALTGEIHS